MSHPDFPTYRGRMEYVCLECNTRYPGDDLLYTCPCCGGVFLLENLDFDRLKERNGAQWREIFDARATSRSTALRGIFRYYELLAPLPDEEDILYLGEGFTPVVEAAPALRDRVGVPFAYKNDGQNPSASFKDRGMACAFSYLKWLCRHRQWDEVLTVCASTGLGCCRPVCRLCGRAAQIRRASAPRQGHAPAAFPASGQRSRCAGTAGSV